MIEFTEVEAQAIFSVFTGEVERLEQEDKGGWDVAHWIGFSVFQEVAEKAGQGLLGGACELTHSSDPTPEMHLPAYPDLGDRTAGTPRLPVASVSMMVADAGGTAADA
jgi:hypothetical protein